jgi:hypothetical protein
VKEAHPNHSDDKLPFGMSVLILRGANTRLAKAISTQEDLVKVKNLSVEVRNALHNVKHGSCKKGMNDITVQLWSSIYEDAVESAEAILDIASVHLSSSLKCL